MQIFFIIISIILVASGNFSCSSESSSPQTKNNENSWKYVPDTSKSVKSEKIVAEVDEYPVTKEQLHEYAKENKLSKSEALRELINQTLLRNEFLHNSPPDEQSRIYKSVTVYNFIREKFLQNDETNSISDEKVKKVYDEIQSYKHSRRFRKLKFYFKHQQWRQTVQLVIKKNALINKDSRASALSMFKLVRSWLLARKVDTVEEFRNSAWVIQNSFYPVRFEKVLPLSANWKENFFRTGRNYNQVFVNKIFEIKKENGISEVFETEQAIHLVFLEKIIPAKNESFAEVKDKLRAKLAAEIQARNFEKWLHQLRAKYDINIYYQSLFK
ncbi:MAG: peptidylprolyl isomerase [Myxococcota bacterium]